MIDTLSSLLKAIRREIKPNGFLSHNGSPASWTRKALLRFISQHFSEHNSLAMCDGGALKGIGELEQLKFSELVALLKRGEAYSSW